MRRTAVTGAAVALAYLGVVVATSLFTSHSVRPLFDAGAPPAPYRWMKPPPDFAPGNVKPTPTDVIVGVKPDDLPPSGSSEDGQFVFSVPKGAIAATATATQVNAHIVPVDPDTLGPLPPKEFADGNAYQITFRYVPGDQPAGLTAPGSVLLTVPVPADAVEYSQDGKTWQAVKSTHASATQTGADMPGVGYYLAVSPDVIASTGGGGGGVGRVIVPVLITIVVAAALVGTPVALRRRRR